MYFGVENAADIFGKYLLIMTPLLKKFWPIRNFITKKVGDLGCRGQPHSQRGQGLNKTEIINIYAFDIVNEYRSTKYGGEKLWNRAIGCCEWKVVQYIWYKDDKPGI